MGEMYSINIELRVKKHWNRFLGTHQNFDAIFYMGRLNAPLGDQSGRLNAHQILSKRFRITMMLLTSSFLFNSS